MAGKTPDKVAMNIAMSANIHALCLNFPLILNLLYFALFNLDEFVKTQKALQ
jgi:hypothetical protein